MQIPSWFRAPAAKGRGSLVITLAAAMLAGAPASQAADLVQPKWMARPGHAKIAADLNDGIEGPANPRMRWSRELGGRHHVQMIVVSNAKDPEMTELRAHVEALGGRVLVRHGGIHALTVMLPASQVRTLADHDDVVSLSPNRTVTNAFSNLEIQTGTNASNVRPISTATTSQGLDGSGIGIAFLDSGLMHGHTAFNGLNGSTRIKRHVNMLNSTVANWSAGAGNILALQPGSAAQLAYEKIVANDAGVAQDTYGHGTHVASMAAGASVTTVEIPAFDSQVGVARNANLFDVKVMGDDGIGTVSDAIEGIQWVIYHAREYNIRVMNLSLAASSAESWRTDPLCLAARSAVAAGITVVVSAGNAGKNSAGQVVYGAIGAPGNDPSVITVGAVNAHSQMTRGDDTVTAFSSRGPTRGAYVDATGKKLRDNLLKPDLVAPGNRIMGAAAYTTASG